MPKNEKIAIIGAGITGLATAFWLKKAGKDVVVIEKNNFAGGVMQTIENDGFVYETGPNTGVLSSPELVKLFDDLGDSCQVETANKLAKSRWILKKGKWHALPSNPVNATFTPLFTFSDKLRVLGEPFRKPGTDPYENFADLVKRRLGKSFLDYAIDPFISGIYAGDPNKLIPKFALPKLYNLEQNYGSFIKGAIKKRKEPKTELEKRATKEVFSVKGGFKNLINALTDKILEKNIFLNCKDLKISHKGDKFNINFYNKNEENNIVADKVISTVGSFALKNLFDFLPENKLEKITNLDYAKVVLTVVGYDKWQGIDLPAFGGLVPTLEKRNVLGILFPSSIFEGRNPEGGALLSVFMGGTKRPDIFEKSEDEIKEIARKEIHETLDKNLSQPDFIEVFKYEHAIPQYDIKSEARFEAIAEIEKQFNGLFLAGNIRDGIGISDRVKQAYNIANQIIEDEK